MKKIYLQFPYDSARSRRPTRTSVARRHREHRDKMIALQEEPKRLTIRLSGPSWTRVARQTIRRILMKINEPTIVVTNRDHPQLRTLVGEAIAAGAPIVDVYVLYQIEDDEEEQGSTKVNLIKDS